MSETVSVKSCVSVMTSRWVHCSGRKKGGFGSLEGRPADELDGSEKGGSLHAGRPAALALKSDRRELRARLEDGFAQSDTQIPANAVAVRQTHNGPPTYIGVMFGDRSARCGGIPTDCANAAACDRSWWQHQTPPRGTGSYVGVPASQRPRRTLMGTASYAGCLLSERGKPLFH